MVNQFVWADLSTYDPRKSIAFYENVFGWKFFDSGGYFVAMCGSSEIIGLFETPDFFKKIKMPHFWMSYIAVADAEKTAEVAGQFENAKVELVDDFYGGKIALIRDPMGAGFTVYDGGKLDSRRNTPGHLVWNELHVSNASSVLPFYEALFEWKIEPVDSLGEFSIKDSNQRSVASLSEIPVEWKGKYEYWLCSFAVESPEQTKQIAIRNGGGIVYDEGGVTILHDDSGEAFFQIRKADR